MDFPIKSVSDLENISSAVRWQYFEKLVAFVFEQNGFDAQQNVIVKDGVQKRQFDVIAKRYGITYLVECKKWRSKERVAGIRPATKKHIERCDFYVQLYTEKILPVIVTLMDDKIEEENGVPIVPIIKLNAWLNDEQ